MRWKLRAQLAKVAQQMGEVKRTLGKSGLTRQHLTSLLLDCDTEPTEALVGFILLGMGVQLLLPGEVLASNPAYHLLFDMFPDEWMLALICIGIGIAKWAGILIGDGHAFRRTASGAASLLFALFFVSTIAQGASSLAAMKYGALALASLWVQFRLIVKHEEAGGATGTH